jgi:hypothetical protein
VIDCLERHGEGGPERTLGRAAGQAAQRRGQAAANCLDAAAEPFGETSGEAAAAEATGGESEFVELGARQSRRHDDEGGHGPAPSGSVGRRRLAVIVSM